jgi:outer membrane protein
MMRRSGLKNLTAGAAAIAIMAGFLGTPALAVSSLEEALVQTYQTNPTLLSERADLRATDENVAQAASNWRPTVTVTGTISDLDSRVDNGPGEIPFGPSNVQDTDSETFGGTVVASQNVFRGFRSVNEFRQAQAGVRAGRAGLHSVEQTVFLDAIAAFLDVIRDEAVVELRGNNVTVLQRQLDASQDRFDLGDSTRTDVAQSEARLSLARANLTAAEAQSTVSRAAFERVIGSEPGPLLSPEALPTIPATEEQAMQMALDNNPALRAAIEAEVMSRRAIDIAVGSLLPSARVDATLQHSEDNDDRRTQSDSATISGTVTIPLYQSGAEYSAIRQARQSNSADRIRIAEAERQIREAVAVAWDALKSTQSVITSSEEQVRANEIAFEGVQQEAQVGSRTTLDVLNAEQELLDSRVTLVRAQRDEQVAAYQLLAAIGELTAEDLGLPVDYYDPGRNYRRVWWLPIGWGAGQ